MAPRTRKSKRLLGVQASEGFNESHTSLDHSSMRTSTTNEVSVVGQDIDVQHISNPTLPQSNLIGESNAPKSA